MHNMNKYYTVEEISKIYRVSMYTIREWAKQGKIKTFKQGRRWLFTDNIFFDQNKDKIEPEKNLTPMT